MSMFSHEVRSQERQMLVDHQHLVGLLYAYRHPDPRLGGTPEALPVLAGLMLPSARGYLVKYSVLCDNEAAPARLRLNARPMRMLAEELVALLADLSSDNPVSAS